MNPFWMVIADLRKTFLASLGVLVLLAVAFSATVTVNLFERSLREAGAVSARDFDLVVGAPGSRLDLVLASVYLRSDEVLPLLPYSVVEGLQADPRVAGVSPLIFSDHFEGGPIVGIGPGFPSLRPTLRLASGRWPEKPFETVAGASTHRATGFQFHGSHGVASRPGVDEEVHEQASYQVVGTLTLTGTPWDHAYLTPVESVWALHEKSGSSKSEDRTFRADPGVGRRVSAVLIKPRDFPAAYGLRAQYREGDTTAAFPGEVLAQLFGVFDTVKTALSVINLVFQALVFLAVLLSLLAGLPSKARWIGLLRALGAGPFYVFLTLWLQSALVFMVSGVVGAMVGWLGAQSLAGMVGTQSGMAFSVRWSWAEAGLLATFWLVGLAGAMVPAWVGYRTSIRRSLLGQ